MCTRGTGRACKATLQELTEEIRGLMAGKPPETRDPAYPPVDSGILGEKPPADNLSMLVGVGASLFDDRFGLADRKPKELETMPFLANDRLDPKLSHGDISIILEAGHNDTVQFALRQLMRRTRSDLTLRWMIDGYARGIGAGADLGSRDAAKPVGIQGRNGQPRRRRRRSDGPSTSGCSPTTASPSGRSAVHIRPSASSGCSSSSGTAPASPSRRR